MNKMPEGLRERKLMLRRTYTSIGIFFCVIIISLYTFAWIRGSNIESILVSGGFLLVLTIFVCGLLYLHSVRVAKIYENESPLTVSRGSGRSYSYSSLFVFLTCDILGVIMIFSRKMTLMLLGSFIIIIGTMIFYVSTRK